MEFCTCSSTISVKYKSGKKHLDADALSRYPVDEPKDEEFSLCSLESVDVAAEQRKDPTMRRIIDALITVFEEGNPPPKSVKNLHDYSLQKGILYKANFHPT